MFLMLQFRDSLIQCLQQEVLTVLCDTVTGKVQEIHLLYPAVQILNTFLWLVIQKMAWLRLH